MNNIKIIFANAKKFVNKHNSEILTGLGIASMVASTIYTVKATIKAKNIIDEHTSYEEETVYADNEKHTITKAIIPSKKECFKLVWKEYIPTLSFSVSGILFICGGSYISNKKGAAIATAYAISERTLHDYRNKVIETIGEKREKDIHEKISQDHINADEPKKETIIITSKGNTLIRDEWSGRYFYSDLDHIRKSINELNHGLFSYNFVSLNEFYNKIGLESVKEGDNLGWNIDNGLIDIDIDACIGVGEYADTPCLTISFTKLPTQEN